MSQTEVANRPVFRAGVIVALVLVGVFAFCAFVTLKAFAPDGEHDNRCRSNVYSQCVMGFAALAELAKADGTPVLVSRTPLPKGRTEGLLIATPEPARSTDITGLGFGGPILVVMPKWMAFPDPRHTGWGVKAGLLPDFMWNSGDLTGVNVDRRAGQVRPTLTGVAGTPFEGLKLTPGKVEDLQTFTLQTLTSKGWDPAMTDETGRVVIAQAPSSRIFVLADPDLVNTRGLGDLDTFATAVSILRALRAGEGPVIFDVTLNGYKLDRSLLQEMFKPPFVAVTLCTVAAMALAGLQAFFRFGPMRRRERIFALGKEALTDNSAQLIRLAGREAKMAPGYAELTRKAAARAVGAPRELSGQALTDFLDRLAAQRGLPDNLATLTHEAGRAEGRAQLIQVASRLYKWRLEMTRERQ